MLWRIVHYWYLYAKLSICKNLYRLRRWSAYRVDLYICKNCDFIKETGTTSWPTGLFIYRVVTVVTAVCLDVKCRKNEYQSTHWLIPQMPSIPPPPHSNSLSLLIGCFRSPQSCDTCCWCHEVSRSTHFDFPTQCCTTELCKQWCRVFLTNLSIWLPREIFISANSKRLRVVTRVPLIVKDGSLNIVLYSLPRSNEHKFCFRRFVDWS